MRLIDADKLPATCNVAIVNGKVELDGWIAAKRITEAPTVKAIPIEWLEQMWERDKDGYIDEYGQYHDCEGSLGESCRQVLENWNTNYKWKWEKENE